MYKKIKKLVVHTFTSCEYIDNNLNILYNQVVNMSLGRSCSFFGHSEIEITEKLKLDLKNFIENLIVKENCSVFYFGGFGMFDDLCHKIVSDLKQEFPHIKRIFCLSDPRHQSILKRPSWLKNEDYEEFVYLELSFDYWYTRIYYRNCEIVNISDYVITYVRSKNNSGAYKILKYAQDTL